MCANSCGFDLGQWQGILETTLCDKFDFQLFVGGVQVLLTLFVFVYSGVLFLFCFSLS